MYCSSQGYIEENGEGPSYVEHIYISIRRAVLQGFTCEESTSSKFAKGVAME